MAVTKLHTSGGNALEHIKVNFTADGDINFQPEHPMRAMTIQGDGNDGGGTVSLQGSNDGTNFFALPTAVSLSAAGLASVVQADLGYLYYNVHLTGSTGPTLQVDIGISYNQ